MLDSQNAREGRGVWLWAATTTLLLFFLEFILFVSLVPGDWANTVAETENRWLVATQGPDSARAIQERGRQWYDAIFTATGIAPWTYRLVTTGPGVPSGQGLEALDSSPIWGWLRGRLDAIWGAFAQALQRLAMVISWWPFLAILVVASIGDGLLRRSIRRYGFLYASPLIHHGALWIMGVIWAGVGLLLFAPIPIPALALPAIGLATAIGMNLALTHTPARV